jgi:hypothetical protein
MKSKEEFKRFVEVDLKPIVAELETKRSKAKAELTKKMQVGFGIGAFLGILISVAIFLFTDNDASIGELVKYGAILGVILGLVGLVISSQKAMRGLNKQADPIKKALINPIVNFVNPDFKYHPDEKISREEIDESYLFQTEIDQYYGDDLIEGFVNEVPFKLSETSLRVKSTTSDSNGHSHISYPDIFNGIFCITELREKRVGDLFILPNPKSKRSLKMREKIELSDIYRNSGLVKNRLKWDPDNAGIQQLKFIETGDKLFDQEFLIYAENAREAQSMLHKEVRNSIYMMLEQCPDFVYPLAPLYISIRNNRLYIAKRLSAALFIANLQRSLTDESEMMWHYNQLRELDTFTKWITRLSREIQQ